MGVGGGFVFQAEDGIRYLVRSRGLGDVYKRQGLESRLGCLKAVRGQELTRIQPGVSPIDHIPIQPCLLYTSDAADERSSVDLGGRRIIKKKNNVHEGMWRQMAHKLKNIEHVYTHELKETHCRHTKCV